MKKSNLSVSLLVAAMALATTACSDYDNGFTEKDINFQQEFKATFDEVDSEQDWNLAERAEVTVTTSTASRVRIYVERGGEFCIVGDYADVIGTRTLGFDMLEGTERIVVTDGRTAVPAVPGGEANFSNANLVGTRTVYGGNGFVQVQKIENAAGVTIGGVTYPMYKEATEDDYEAMKSVIPEIGYRKNYTNLNKVTHDFSYVSTGEFIIYPYYWETSSNNTIGIYYYDQNGQRQEVDVYTIKSGSELQFHKSVGVYESPYYPEQTEAVGNAQWYKDYQAMTWTDQTYNMLRNMGLPNGNLLTRFTDLVVDVDMKKYTTGVRVLFYKSDGTNKIVRIPNPSPSASGTQNVKQTINLQQLVNSDASIRDYLENCWEVRLAGDNVGNTTFKDNIGNDVIGDIVINDIHFQTSDDGGWKNYGNAFCSEIFTQQGGDRVRGQGIVIDIPVGTVFGMYLKKKDGDVPYTFYSEGSLNDPAKCGNGVTDDNNGNVVEVPGMNPCYASTFHVSALGDQMFLGFEDWPNTQNASDFDLNDVVLAFSGATPTIINEDTTPAGTWMLACEDLGGTFDIDYNDVVLKINHISGQNFATLTPLAAGGTLASYIFFIDPTSSIGGRDKCFGEVHQLFGVEPAISGAYDPINVEHRGSAGQEMRFEVDEEWTLAYYSSDTWNKDSQYAPNMGGFEIRTLPKGAAPISNASTLDVNSDVFTGASRIPAPDLGEAPYIICLPYSYITTNQPAVGKKTEHVWAWALEFQNINGPYPDFAGWVADHTQNGDWYKHRRANGRTVEPLEIVSDMTAEEIAATIEGGGGNTQPQDPTKLNADFGTYAQYALEGYNYPAAWSADGEGHTAELYTGQAINITAYINSYSGPGTISASLNAGGTGSVLTNEGNSFKVKAGATSGTATLTIHFTGDDEYNAKDLVFPITVKARPIYRITCVLNGTTYALTNDNGAIKIKTKNDWDDPNQKWGVERDSNSAYNFLFSIGGVGYMLSTSEAPWRPILQSAAPKNNEYGRFRFVDYGDGQHLYLRHYERGYFDTKKYDVEMFMGADSFTDGASVYMNKTGGNIITWHFESVNP